MTQHHNMTEPEFRTALEITLAFWLDAATRDAQSMADTKHTPSALFHRRSAEKNFARALGTLAALNGGRP